MRAVAKHVAKININTYLLVLVAIPANIAAITEFKVVSVQCNACGMIAELLVINACQHGRWEQFFGFCVGYNYYLLL